MRPRLYLHDGLPLLLPGFIMPLRYGLLHLIQSGKDILQAMNKQSRRHLSTAAVCLHEVMRQMATHALHALQGLHSLCSDPTGEFQFETSEGFYFI